MPCNMTLRFGPGERVGPARRGPIGWAIVANLSAGIPYSLDVDLKVSMRRHDGLMPFIARRVHDKERPRYVWLPSMSPGLNYEFSHSPSSCQRPDFPSAHSSILSRPTQTTHWYFFLAPTTLHSDSSATVSAVIIICSPTSFARFACRDIR